MDPERKQKLARATADLLQAVRELSRAKAEKEAATNLLAKSAPQRFLRAIEAFAEVIGS
jgi:hypothetical protein